MVDEVFALSPISARAAQPNEADYEAIRDAFMETSRGRWFLGEYAKRNRNADTSMVLDAVARIEHALASQRQQQQEIEQADSKALPEVLAVIRAAVEDAALAAASAVDSLALEQNLAPVRKGTRIIKEISWRWREIGADSRICDLIDSQVTSIEFACNQLASADPKVALLAAFEIIKARLKELDERPVQAAPAAHEIRPTAEASTAAPQEAAPAPIVDAPVFPEPETARHPESAAEQPAPAASPLAATSPLVAAVASIEAIETAAATVAIVSEAGEAEPVQAAVPASPPEAVAAPSIAEALADIEQQAPVAELEDAAAAEAQDEAILELVAAEMGAPDPMLDEDFNRARTLGFDIEEPTAVDDDIVASFRDPGPAEVATDVEPTDVKAPAVPVAPAPPPAPVADAPAASAPAPLASTLLAPAPAAPVAAAPPTAPTAVPDAPAPLPESIAAETLAAVAAAMAAPPPPAFPQSVVTPASPATYPAAAAAASTSSYAMPKPAYEPSLGSTLLSNGVLQRPQAPANDALAPIRRMTQPEKVAFFS
ncbi:hypothetical protein ACQR0Z_10325 [Bradyrhizobium sp. HKCCYLS3077]|uniref:hypothetical protein n=1 Tax=Bradyrhizobium sp. HKCCYLS3077 TaxID=3420761 RepID=UPI003EB8632E